MGSSSGVRGRSSRIGRTSHRSRHSDAVGTSFPWGVPPDRSCSDCNRCKGGLTAPERWGSLTLRRHPLTCWGFGWSRPEAPFPFSSLRPRARPYLNSFRPSGRGPPRGGPACTPPPPCLLHDRKRPLIPPPFVQRSPPLPHPRPSNLIGFGRPLTAPSHHR